MSDFGGMIDAQLATSAHARRLDGELERLQAAYNGELAARVIAERERNEARAELAGVVVERDDARALVASVCRSNWIVARDGGRHCERCEAEVARGQAYKLEPGTGGLIVHIHCPTPGGA